MAKTVKMENAVHPHDTKEGQQELSNELPPRKMSEIIADKKAALKKNEDLLRALQQLMNTTFLLVQLSFINKL